jgi:hypothetical protein
MLYRFMADAVLALHLAFIVFALLGGLLAIRFPWVALVHLPTAAWGAFVELTGRICPLTPLENAFRVRAGDQGYTEGFIEHYLLPIIYPSALTRDVQLWLAGVVIAVNLLIYVYVLHRRRRD